uniref:Uncharacterized protein n=1 Tax=Tanacetum cinerariifolium TaxID=118510 RepID=A0A6L2J2E9_TANCI|nr:hypothetical protein [Tanacetum cinerariifolium]
MTLRNTSYPHQQIRREDEESYASEFSDFVFLDEEDFDTRLEPGRHKENPKTVDDDDDDDDKKKEDKKYDDNDDDHASFRARVTDSFSEADFKYLNKNDIEDMYYLCLNNLNYREKKLLCSLMAFIKSRVIWERVHDFQLGIKSYQIKINLTAPTLIFPGIEAYDPYSIVDKLATGLIYLNNKNEKSIMSLVEIVKFCDATLERVLKEVKLNIFETEFLNKASLLGELDIDIMKVYEREITKRLRHREQMRRWESFVNARLILPKHMTPPYFNTYQSSYNNPQPQQQFSTSQYGSIHPTQHYSSTYPSQPQFNHSSIQSSYPYQSQMNHQTSSVSQIAYQSPQVSTQPITESPLVDSGLAVSVFSPRDDPIACLNKAMTFLTAVASSRQCSQPKRLRNAAWYKEKAMLAKAQEAGKILDEEQLAFLADPKVPDGQAFQTIILNNAAF